jgi:hypothetical protein
MVPSFLAWLHSALVLDIKGELADRDAAQRRHGARATDESPSRALSVDDVPPYSEEGRSSRSTAAAARATQVYLQG